MSTLQLLGWFIGTCAGICLGSLLSIPICDKINKKQWKKFEEEMRRYK